MWQLFKNIEYQENRFTNKRKNKMFENVIILCDCLQWEIEYVVLTKLKCEDVLEECMVTEVFGWT